MKEAPKTWDEARERVNTYYAKLISEGKTENEAYNIAIGAYKKSGLKEKFAAKPMEIIDTCFLCHSPILVGEDYTVCVAIRDGTLSWHTDCEDESPANALKVSQIA